MSELATHIKDITIILGVVTPVLIIIYRLIQGVKCLLRDRMLHIYYKNEEQKTIRQYQLENFVFLYKAYKALKGNSFIDKIHEEVMSWEVVT